MTLVITAGVGWLLLSVPVAAVLGRAIRLGDQAVGTPSSTDAIERYLADQAPASLS